MSQAKNDHDEIREQTAARGGVRGKYYERYMRGSNVVLLAPDLAPSQPSCNAESEK